MTILLGCLKLLSMDTLDINCHLKWQIGTGMRDYNTRVSKTKLLSIDTLGFICQLKWYTGTGMHDYNTRVSKTAKQLIPIP